MTSTLYLKHLLATSRAAPWLHTVRGLAARRRNLSRPELGLLREEDRFMRAELRKLLKPETCCVDVGAHIGSLSHLFRTWAPRGRHVLIEASPDKAAWLRRRFPQASVHQVAVSDSEGSVDFFQNLDRPGFSSLTDRSGRGTTVSLKVPCTTLDTLLAGTEAIGLMKIDVEGHELAVVRGARQTLGRLRPVLLFEAGAVHDRDIDNASYAALFRLLADELGYRIYPVYRLHFGQPPITAAEFETCRSYPFLGFNFFALPPGT